MEQPEAELIWKVIEAFALKFPENVNSRLDTLASRISSLEQTHMATMQEFTDAITQVNAGLDNINKDLDTLAAEIQALKDQVATLGLTQEQATTVLNGLTALAGRVDTIAARTPDPVPEPPAEPPAA